MLGEIREAGIGDAAEIAAIHVASWRVTYADLLPPAYLGQLRVAHVSRRWQRRLQAREPAERILVATHADHVAGFVTFGPARDRGEDSGFAGEVTMLYVRPELEGLGVGSRLLVRAVDELRAADLYWAIIWAVDGNRSAIDFYQRHGFQLDGARRVDPIGGGQTPLVRLARSLGPALF